MKLRRFANWILLMATATVISFFAAELFLKIQLEMSSKTLLPNESPTRFALRTQLQKKINRLWYQKKEEKSSPFEPPFPVFINEGVEDPARMDFIAQTAKLEPSKTWLVQNFLLSEEFGKTQKYKITSNSLGFRGPERSIRRRPNLVRILVYGSYPAFGHGVNDDETYESVMESELNSKFKNKYKFEVWNGGRQGGTAIMGLARLLKEQEVLKPDLLIFDYGWIEMQLQKDSKINSARHLNYTVDSTFASIFFGVCRSSFFQTFEICRRAQEKLFSLNRPRALNGFINICKKVIEYCRQQNLPVLFVRQMGVEFGPEVFKEFIGNAPQVFFVNTPPFLNRVDSVETEKFWARPNWITDLGLRKDEITKPENPPIRGDAIQFSALGLKIIGQVLAEKTTELIEDNQIELNNFKARKK